MYIGKIAPPTVRVKNKVYYLEGEHGTKAAASTVARQLRDNFMMDTIIRKKKTVYAIYGR